MSTSQQVINRSLRKIGALAAGETPSSDMSTDALADLNAMLARWIDLGIEIAPGELTLSDDCPNDIADEDAVVYNLGVVLLLEYPNPNVPLVATLANDFYRDILTKYSAPEDLQHENGLQILTNPGYNINTDL